MGLLGGNNEKSIARRLRHGDNAAMRDFYALFANYLTGVCSRYISNDDDVKDVLQDCMVSIIQHIDSFEYRGNGSLKAWATKIAVNCAIRFLKDGKRLETVELPPDIGNISDEEPPDTDDIPPEAIHAMIRRLPEGYRTVFNLYVVEGKSHHEIAQTLGIKEMSSASQLHRAKTLLAKEINKYKSERTYDHERAMGKRDTQEDAFLRGAGSRSVMAGA